MCRLIEAPAHFEYPEDPFNAEPGIADARIMFRQSVQVDLKVNDQDQPIHLYYQSDAVGPEWIQEVCADFFDGDPATTVPEPFGAGPPISRSASASSPTISWTSSTR
jgi:hypothetical protein